MRDVLAMNISIPSLKDQRRIAEELDFILSLKEDATQQIPLLDEQVKSLFNELFTNHKELLSYLPLEKVAEEQRPITYGVVKPGPFTPGGVPIIKVKDFPNGVVDAQEFYLISSELANSYKRSTLKANDLLISIRGAIGKTAFVPPELDGANLTQDTARVSIKSEYNRHYIRAAIDSDLIQENFKQHTVGAAVKGINLGYLRTVLIPVPPKAIQDDYAIKVSEIDKLRFISQFFAL